MNAKDTRQTLAAIAAGTYRHAYLVYARKSTDEPDSQKNSIAHQKAEGLGYCQAARLPVAPVTLPGFCTEGMISERHSAFKESVDMQFGDNGSVRYRVERPKFHRLASLLADGCFKGVVFLCWDRASRNKGDELIIRKLMKAGVDVRFVLATYDDTSAGELHKDIDGMFSEHHSRVTREKVTATMRRSRDRGLCTHKAPVGYLNNGSMEWKPCDPERAPLILQLFEMADRTTWSLSDLRRWAIAQGFTMPPTRRRRTKAEMLEDEERDERRDLEKLCRHPTVSQVHLILTNPFYTGKVRGNFGQWVPSTSHEALVSQALFDRVQEKLGRRRTSVHYDKKLDLPFRGFLRCTCGRIFTPYEQKGHVYFGARCNRSCPNPNKSVNLAFVHEVAGRAIRGLAFTDEELTRIDAATGRGRAKLEEQRDQAHDAKGRRARKLREDLAYVDANRVTLLRAGVYTPEALAEAEARMKQELSAIEAEPTASADDVRDFVERVVSLSELLKTAQDLYGIADPPKKERYARLVLSELTLGQETLDFKCKNGFRPFERRLFSESALSEWLSEAITHRDDLTKSRDALEAFVNNTSECP